MLISQLIAVDMQSCPPSVSSVAQNSAPVHGLVVGEGRKVLSGRPRVWRLRLLLRWGHAIIYRRGDGDALAGLLGVAGAGLKLIAQHDHLAPRGTY